MDEFVLRKAVSSDLEEIMRLESSSFDDPWSYEMFCDEIDNAQSHFVVLQAPEGGLAGYMISWMLPAIESQIGSIAVDLAQRRKGLGTRLMKDLEAECRRLAIGDITLEVRVSNHPAICLYKSLGFCEEGIRPGYYSDGEDAIIMWKRDV